MRDLIADIAKLLILVGIAIVVFACSSNEREIPASILWHKYSRGPVMYAGDKRWGGFNPCKFVDRVKKDGSYWVLPSDLGGECLISSAKLALAYDGYCANGVRDKKGPHFTTPLNPRAKLTTYADGVRVIELNHYLKAFETTDEEDEKAAVEYYKGNFEPFMPCTEIDIRADNVPLFGHEQIDFIPARKVAKP